MNPKTKKLYNELRRAPYSTEMISAINRLSRTGDPDAIWIIAKWLDMPGIVGRKAARALMRMGPAVIPEMCKRIESDDKDVICNSHRVLRYFGVTSAALTEHEPCWACAAYLKPLRVVDAKVEEAAE